MPAATDFPQTSLLRDTFLAAVQWVFPRSCAGCGGTLHYAEPLRLCSPCLGALHLMEEPLCARCGIYLPDGGNQCFDCRSKKPDMDVARSFAAFEGPMRRMIHAFKYGGRDYLSEDLAAMLMRLWKTSGELKEAELILPVPLHAQSLRERGYNQSELLSRKLSALCDIPCMNGVLSRSRKTESQTRLSREERKNNVYGAFSLSKTGEIKGRSILVVDDVYTTGATLNACAKTLKEAGAKHVFGLTVARDF